MERINLWRLRALPAGSAGLTAQTSVRARCLRGWGTGTTRFSGLSCPNSQPAAPSGCQPCLCALWQCAGAAPEQPLLRAAASHPLLLCACRRETAARPVAEDLGRRRRPADRPVIGQRARNGGRWRRDLALRPAHVGLTADWLAAPEEPRRTDSPIQPALLSATHPFFCSVTAVFLARPTSQSR